MISEGIPISEPTDSRFFQTQTGRGVVVGTTQVSSRHLTWSLEEGGGLGLRICIEGVEGVIDIGERKDERKFKVTWDSTYSRGGETSLNWMSHLMITP